MAQGGCCLRGQACPHRRQDLPSRGQHTEKCRRAAVYECLPIHENFEFSVVAPKHLHIGLQLTTKPRRHTDGVQS